MVAEFTDKALLNALLEISDGGDMAISDEPPCAAFPMSQSVDFAWSACEWITEVGDSGARDYQLATGADSLGQALGVTYVRLDGSGISVVVSTAQYDRSSGDAIADGLAEPPLTHLELVEVIDQLDTMASTGHAGTYDLARRAAADHVRSAPAPTRPRRSVPHGREGGGRAE